MIQFFKNLGLTVANIALGIGNAIAALGSNIMTAFHNAICSVQAWWYDLLSTCLSVIESICAALNKLPFVEFDYSGISNAADDYAAKAAEAAGNKEDYTSISDAFNDGFSTFDTFQDGWAADAFDAGASWGDGVADEGADGLVGGAEGGAGLHIHQTAQGRLNTHTAVELGILAIAAGVIHQDHQLTCLQHGSGTHIALSAAAGRSFQHKFAVMQALDYTILHFHRCA